MTNGPPAPLRVHAVFPATERETSEICSAIFRSLRRMHLCSSHVTEGTEHFVVRAERMGAGARGDILPRAAAPPKEEG